MLTVIQTQAHPCVSLQQIKAHLRLDHSEDDDYLTHLIKVATDWVEEIIDSPLLNTTFIWQTVLSEPHIGGLTGVRSGRAALTLPKQNVIELKRIAIIDSSGQKRQVNYRIQEEGARTMVHANTTHRCFEIEFAAGFGERAESVPSPLLQAVITHVACHYECRTGIDRNDYLSLLQMVQPYRQVGLS
ncbi:MAG: head-tail connector protein [Candidatus Paracaedibacteraceae bacterium]|nr:head-tail connector protein [Candidatus Paracaedibacteraceae bacterium]